MSDKPKVKRWTKPVASFNGKHNEAKAMCFIWLYELSKMGDNFGLTVKGLYDFTGINAGYVQERIRFWKQWKYLIRKVSSKPRQDGGLILYSLSSHGKEYVTDKIPPEKYQEYLAKIMDWQRKQTGNDMHMESV
jgi:hypothetical protein